MRVRRERAVMARRRSKRRAMARTRRTAWTMDLVLKRVVVKVKPILAAGFGRKFTSSSTTTLGVTR